MCSGVPLHVPQKFFWARSAVWKACQASVLWIRSVQRTQPCRYKVQWVRVIKPESHPLRHLKTPRHPIKSEKPLTWMVEGFFCVQRCLKNPFPRLYSRCILPYLDFLRPSCFSLCTPKTYLHRLFHDGFVQQPSAYPASIQWKGAGIVSQLVLLTVVCRKGTILWIRPLWKKEKSIDIKDAVFYPLEEV